MPLWEYYLEYLKYAEEFTHLGSVWNSCLKGCGPQLWTCFIKCLRGLVNWLDEKLMMICGEKLAENSC